MKKSIIIILLLPILFYLILLIFGAFTKVETISKKLSFCINMENCEYLNIKILNNYIIENVAKKENCIYKITTNSARGGKSYFLGILTKEIDPMKIKVLRINNMTYSVNEMLKISTEHCD